MLLVSYNLAIFLLLPLTTFDQNVDHYCHFRVEQHSQGDGGWGGGTRSNIYFRLDILRRRCLQMGPRQHQGLVYFRH